MQTWSHFESTCTIIGTKYINTIADCAIAAQKLGLARLPPSYVEYVTRFGSGIWSKKPLRPGLLIKVPTHSRHSLTLESCATMFLPNPNRPDNPYGNPDTDRMMVFGSPFDGISLAWNLDSVKKDGEMDIYLIDSDPHAIVKCGSNLLEFLIDFWVGLKLDQVSPFSDATWKCDNSFSAISNGKSALDEES